MWAISEKIWKMDKVLYIYQMDNVIKENFIKIILMDMDNLAMYVDYGRKTNWLNDIHNQTTSSCVTYDNS